MWWEPRGQFEEEVRSQVERLSGYLRERRQGYQVVHGVGSILLGEGRRAPLLAVDRDLGNRYRGSVDPLRELLEWLRERSGEERKRSAEDALAWIRDHLSEYTQADETLRRLLGAWDVPRNTWLLFIPRPKPLADRSIAVARFARETATVGLVAALVDGRTALATAGHLVPGPGNVIQVLSSLFEIPPLWDQGVHKNNRYGDSDRVF